MTLQILCLTAIGNSIDRFYHAYSTTDDNDLQLSFHFLQKLYSSQLISSLYYKEKLQERYIDLLFSEHLKSVETKWFSKLSPTAISELFAKIGPNLESVIFSNESGSIQWSSIICHLSNVKTITFQATCRNDVLRCIAKYCPRLETLDVEHSLRITADGLKGFYQKEQGKVACPLLKNFYVKSFSVRMNCIKQLVKNLPLLEDIEHYSELPDILYDLHRKDLKSLDKVQKYNLLHLDLLNYVDKAHTKRYDNILNICVTVCPKLKAFFYPISKLQHLSFCSQLHDVEALGLNCVNNTHIDVNDVLKKKSGKLTNLTLRNCSVSLSVLAQCVDLNFLKMKQVKIQYDEGDFIPLFYNLKILFIKHLDLTKPDYFKVISRMLACSPNLEELILKNCTSFTSQMKSEILKCCQQCPLKTIDITGTPVETNFLKDILLTCSTLEILDLDQHMDVQLEEELRRFTWTLPYRPRAKISISMELSDSDFDNDP